MFASWLNDLSGRLRVLRQEQLRVIQVTGAAGIRKYIDGWLKPCKTMEYSEISELTKVSRFSSPNLP